MSILTQISNKVYPSKLICEKFSRLTVTLTRLQSSTSSQQLKPPSNEPIIDYSADKNKAKKKELLDEVDRLQNSKHAIEVPIVINGIEHKSQSAAARYQSIPYNHAKKVAKFYHASHELIQQAVDGSLKARKDWEQSTALEDRIELFNKAASLASGKYRHKLNAATIVGQAKTIDQAEMDAAAELIDFLRFNAYFIQKLVDFSQPASTKEAHNSVVFRGLDGFVASISPFNFTAIGANLASAPTLLGNTVVWKPSDTSMLANYVTFKLFEEAGFPHGVINFVPCHGKEFGSVITSRADLAAINFTGSCETFKWLWRSVGERIDTFNTFPRLIGETGGKNYHFIHPSARVYEAISETIKSAFQYSGQKCSACSRVYVPQSLYSKFAQLLVELVQSLKVGPPTEDQVYTSAVINKESFDNIVRHIEDGLKDSTCKLLCGGKYDAAEGYFVEPTIFEATDPHCSLMSQEVFGPVLTMYVYDDKTLSDIDSALDLVASNKYALTGSIFAQDTNFLKSAASGKLRMTAGNLYLNQKSTGAVVNQQPFGGSKLSGTNDKAGGPHNLMRFCNQQTIKQARES